MVMIVKPPQPVLWDDRPTVFLAGTIDNGQSEDWQSLAEKSLAGLDIQILNPRRDDWDSSWKQTIANRQFREQVEWELEGLEKVDFIFMYFAAKSQSPITLLELGLHANSERLIISCAQDFWRRGNIEVVANKYNLKLLETLDEGLGELKTRLQ